MTQESQYEAPPYSTDFQLFAPAPHPLAPRVLCEQALAAVTMHVDSVTRWPALPEALQATPPYGSVALYERVGRNSGRVVSVWSEPRQPLVLRAFGHAIEGAPDALITPPQRERLASRGLALTPCGSCFRRDVRSDPYPGSRELAQELLYLLTDGLGYDGRASVWLYASRGDRPLPRMLEAIEHADLGSLFRQRGLQLGPVDHDGHVGWLVRDTTPFLALLEGRMVEAPDRFRGFGLFAFIRLEPALLAPVERELRDTLRFATAQAHDGAKLLVRHDVRIEGGVSVTHLNRMLDLWRDSLLRVADVIQQHRNRLGLSSPR